MSITLLLGHGIRSLRCPVLNNVLVIALMWCHQLTCVFLLKTLIKFMDTLVTPLLRYKLLSIILISLLILFLEKHLTEFPFYSDGLEC